MKLKPTDDSLTEYKDWKLKSIIIYIYDGQNSAVWK